MVTHFESDPDLNGELLAGVATRWDGLFVVRVPYGKKVNVTKDAIWVRDAGLVGLGSAKRPEPADAFALPVDPGRGLGQVLLPKVRLPRRAFAQQHARFHRTIRRRVCTVSGKPL